MYKYEIEGGFPIKGKIRAGGNKNAALPCIAAAMLTEEEVILHNIPEIEDVQVMLKIVEELGGNVKRLKKNSYSIKVGSVSSSRISEEHADKVRASILFAGSLLGRTKEVILPPPGGDIIGRRRLDTHFLAFSELGAHIEIDGIFSLSVNKLIGKDIFLDEASVTATENAVMAAAMAQGTTILRNCASEPHVQDLCNMINAMGGNITGIGSNILTIKGVRKLHGAEYAIGSDFMEVGSLIGLAAVTGGEIEIENACPGNLRMCEIAFKKLGISWQKEGDSILVHSHQDLAVRHDLGGMIPQIDDAPWPGFPPDLVSIMVVVATQVEGTVLIHEKMFESRMFFVDKLIGMGAKIILCDPHRAVVSGPSHLKGADLSSPDVRAGMAMVIAALCAKGKSTIHNVYQIERGYEDISNRLSLLGAKINRVPTKG